MHAGIKYDALCNITERCFGYQTWKDMYVCEIWAIIKQQPVDIGDKVKKLWFSNLNETKIRQILVRIGTNIWVLFINTPNLTISV